MLRRQPRPHRLGPDFLLHFAIDGFFQLFILISRANSRFSRPQIINLTRYPRTGLLSRRRSIILQVMKRSTSYVITRRRFTVSFPTRTANGRLVTRIRPIRLMRTLITILNTRSIGSDQNNVNGVDRLGPHLLRVHCRTPASASHRPGTLTAFSTTPLRLPK